ncbi:MAG: hypothetical protein IJS90_02440 [Clostridia bacterium]|nr:hypothetical protein [Clostridia bacterium]
MRLKTTRTTLISYGDDALRAAAIFENELFYRAGIRVKNGRENAGTVLSLISDAGFCDSDVFEISGDEKKLTFRADDIRGLIFAMGLFLRKAKFTEDEIILVSDIRGLHRPAKPVRGHQLGFRPISNTYDKWGPGEFERYMLELMFFGMNTVEFIPLTEQNSLMKLSGPAMTAVLSEKAKALGLNVSLWIPNGDGSEEDELREREALFKSVPFIDAVFVPGSDPGDLPAKEMLERCKRIKKILNVYHPKAELWPSAQAPHNAPEWGEEFIEGIKSSGGEFAGVITGPNRAFNIDVLREKLPEDTPIRFYPDVTHNLRCEHPVHFDKDDWHYAFSTCLSRESINPRPTEYKRLFETVRPYTVGSVTYSDGVNDDVNKAVWCALEWDPEQKAEDAVEDYVRAYLYGYDPEKSAAAILLLEKNWEGTPLEKRIDFTHYLINSLKKGDDCWRFEQLWFRALCDKYVKERFIADTAAVGAAKAQIIRGDINGAASTLSAPLSEHVTALRDEIEQSAGRLFQRIGMQLGTKDYFSSGWERGATLATIDLPITDKDWLMSLIDRPELLRKAVKRNEVGDGEYYFSLALHGLGALWVYQEPDFYMDFQGDRPNVNNGAFPVCLQKLFDHFCLRAELELSEENVDRYLTVTYKKPSRFFLERHRASVNGTLLGRPKLNELFTKEMCPEGFFAYTYFIPADAISGGRIKLEITERTAGFETAEFRITFKEDFYYGSH